MNRLFPGLLLILLCHCAGAAEIAAGPMPGHSAMRQVIVWVQTDSPAEVRLRYWPVGDQQRAASSAPVHTAARRAHTAELRAVDLEPGTEYAYEVLIDGKAVAPESAQRFQTQPLWQWRGDPPAFRFALGSCAYINEPAYDRPGDPYGGGFGIFDAIADSEPDFMLWLGDNVYYREADWNSRFGMYARFSHARQFEPLARLLTATHHYAVWDDHDYGPNNSDRSYPMRETALEVFDDFWPNPEFSGDGTGGITNHFEWHDAAFFLLDNRFFRQANHRVTGRRQLLGRTQIEWLIDALKSSGATFRFVVVGGQFLNPAEIAENHIRLAPGERRRLLDRLEAERIPGVIFLSGDRHHSVLMKMNRYRTYPLYEWTVSPLTSGPGTPAAFETQYRVEGSLYTERNFGTIGVAGERGERVLTLTLHDSGGAPVWETRIHQDELGVR